MANSSGAVIELRAEGTHGWGYVSGDDVIVPPRVVDAGHGLVRVRRLGQSRWFEWRTESDETLSSLVMGKKRPAFFRRRGQTQSGLTGSPHAEVNVFTLWAQVLSGELDPAAAGEAATGLTLEGDTADSVLAESASMAKFIARSGHTRDAVSLARLVVAVSTARVVGAAPRIQAEVSCEFLETARLRLVEVPDPQLLEMARAVGDAALRWGRDHNDGVIVEIASFRLGTLHLDPYASTRATATYWMQHTAWLRRGMSALGMSPTDASEEDLHSFMPSPAEALRTAEVYLRQAVDARSGEYRGQALKALTQALHFLIALGEDVSLDELEAVSLEALSLIPEHRVEARFYVSQFISAEAKSRLPALSMRTDPAADRSERLNALHAAAAAASGHDPAAATAMVAQLRELKAADSDPDWIPLLLLEMQVAIENTLAPANRKREIWPESEGSQVALRTRIMASQEAAQIRCALLLDLAEKSTALGIGPEQGLLCVEAAVALDPDHLGTPEDGIAYLMARLWFDHAGDLGEIDESRLDPAAVVYAYRWAADLFHRARVPEAAVDALDSLTRFVPRIDPEDCARAVEELVGTTLGLGDRADPETDRVLQEYHATTLGGLLSAETSAELVILVSQVAKGARLASALASGRNAGLAVPAPLQAELTQADADEAEFSDTGADDDLSRKDWLLSSYTDTVEAVPRDTPLRRLRGRQRQLDQEWNDVVPRPGKSQIRSLEGMRELLDDRMMLLIMVPAMWHTTTWGNCWSLITHRAAYIQYVGSDVPYGDVGVEYSGRTMRSSPDCLQVVSLREGLQEDAGPDVATDAVLSLLNGRHLLGNLWDRLDELLRDGHDHLLIAPHGPGHYVPWHLLGDANEPLAARCSVSVLPTLSLLHPGSFTDLAMSRLHAHAPASFGLSYRKVSSRGLGLLADAEAEATEVAKALGVKPVLEERATVGAVLESLQRARFVHLAAHGHHNVDAPAFQSIHLAGSPGLLTAHRLSTLDLRGLRLLTLSACETALGRFDRSDNLRGIPAALFLAGVRSIIGTLWDVRSSAARIFFVTLYQEIANGSMIAGAYRAAQAETRRAFPSYGDWGAFVLMGGLPERYQSKERADGNHAK